VCRFQIHRRQPALPAPTVNTTISEVQFFSGRARSAGVPARLAGLPENGLLASYPSAENALGSRANEP
jgi:hypothetical protein